MVVRKPHLPDNGHEGPLLEPDLAVASIPLSRPSPPPVREMQPELDSLDHDESPAIPNLYDLSRRLRQQEYQKRRSVELQSSLSRLRIAAAKTARLIHATHSIHQTLAECIRFEDKHSFANLFHAFRDASDQLFTASATVQRGPQPWTKLEEEPEPCTSFVNELSEAPREALLDLLCKLRYDGDFIADRLLSLSHKEILALLPERTSSPKASDSVLGTSARPASRTSRPLGYVVDRQLDDLAASAFHSPIEALIFSIHDDIGDKDQEASRRQDVWATVCAKLISEQKPGCERLVPAILDLWASSTEWPGKNRLELWLLRTLQGGQFLTEKPSKRSFQMRMQSQQEGPTEDKVQAELFYDSAVASLLSLLGDGTGATVIPDGALDLCRAVFQKLSFKDRQQKAFPHFVLTRWLLSSFVMNALSLPEAYGMLTDYYISDAARQRILREVATRCHKAVLDVVYSW